MPAALVGPASGSRTVPVGSIWKSPLSEVSPTTVTLIQSPACNAAEVGAVVCWSSPNRVALEHPATASPSARANRPPREIGAMRSRICASALGSRPLCDQRAQEREQLRLAERLLQDRHGLCRRPRQYLVAGGHDDADAAIMQPVDQVVGPLAAAQVQVDKGDRRGLLGGRAIGLGGGRDGSGHIRAPGLEQVLQGDAEMPGVLDQKDALTLQVPGTGSR